MQKRALVLLLIALLMGGVAVILVQNLLQKEVDERAKVEVIETTPVVVAAIDLKTGMRLDKLAVQTVEMPVELVPEGAFSDVNTLLGEKPPIAIKKIAKREVILPYKLSPHGARAGLPPRIPEDMRALTIMVSEITGVAGFVLPGNYVDVTLTSTIGRKDDQPATHTMLQNLLVLGVDQLSSEDEENPKVVNAVTMLVTPDDGKKLVLAQKVGELGLMLRNEFDASILEDKRITTADLLSPAQKPTKPRVYKRIRRPVPTVEIIRGLEIEKQRVKEAEPVESK